MGLANDNDVVQTFAANGTNQSFGIPVLSWRMGRNWFVPNSHGTEALPHDRPEGAISITDQIAWRAIPREGVGDLTRNPVRRWAVRHRNMDELSAVEPNDDEAIEQVECERRDDEQVHRRHLWHMVAQKCPPALARWSVVPAHHVLRDSGLRDLETELQKLAMDARRAPERVFQAHLLDQRP